MSARDLQVFGRMLQEAEESSERGRGRWQGCQWVTLLQNYKGSLCNPQSKHLPKYKRGAALEKPLPLTVVLLLAALFM